MAGLTVVIPALNEARNLPLLLADLHQWPGALEIIVVDGGSSDKTIRVARQAGAHLCKALFKVEDSNSNGVCSRLITAGCWSYMPIVGSASTGLFTYKGYSPWRKASNRHGPLTSALMNADRC